MATYDQFLKKVEGYSIKGAAIRDEKNIFLLFENHYDEDKDGDDWIQKTLIVYYRPDTDKVWGGKSYNNYSNIMGVCLPDQDQTMMFVNRKGYVYTHGLSDGYNFIDQPRVPIENRESLLDISLIDNHLYVGGTGRHLLKFTEDQWLSFGPGGTAEEEKGILLGGTFQAFDGFSANEIYAGGKRGDFWHFDGKSWQPVDLPTNQTIWSICCAGNGKVYLGCSGGVLLEGRGDHWQSIAIPGYFDNTLITGLNWFKDRLFIVPANGLEGLYELDSSGQLSRSQLGHFSINTDNMITDHVLEAMRPSSKGGPVVPGSPHTICSSEDLLLIAGGEAVVVYDGKQWSSLFNMYQSEADLQKSGYQYQP